MSDSISQTLPPRRRFLALLAILIAASTTAMDGVAAAVALPTLSEHFAVEASTSIWVVNVFQLAVVTCLLPMAALSDIFGTRWIYIAGLLVFAVMSALAALAPTLELLILARLFQGISAAAIMSFNLAIVRFIMPPDRLGSAIGLTAMAVAISTCLAPTLSGILLTIGSWRLVFGMSLVMGLAASVLALLTLPETGTRKRTYDFISATLSAITFGSFLLAVSSIGHFWHPVVTVSLFAAGLAAGYALVARLWREPAPLLPLDLLRIRVFALSVSASLCAFCAQMTSFVSLPFFLQTTLDFTVLEAGLVFASWPLALACTAPIAGHLADRLPAGILGFGGMALLATALWILVSLGPQAGPFDVVWPMILCGIGFGLFQSPNNRTIVGSAPKDRSGAAGGVLATARLVGQALGTAVAVVSLSGALGDEPAIALIIAAGFAATGACISIARRGKLIVS